jgi:hypothetical protein
MHQERSLSVEGEEINGNEGEFETDEDVEDVRDKRARMG